MAKAKQPKPGQVGFEESDFDGFDSGSGDPPGEQFSGSIAATEPEAEDPISLLDAEMPSTFAELSIPLGSIAAGGNRDSIHLDVMLTREQSDALRRALVGLKIAEETCSSLSGKRLVSTRQDVVRWILEQI